MSLERNRGATIFRSARGGGRQISIDMDVKEIDK
jgi:hypothetical protein